MTRYLIGVIFTLLISVTGATAQNSVALVVEKSVKDIASGELNKYTQALEKDGLDVYTIVDKWYNPDSIRNAIQKIYLQKDIQGVVFIGDIPVTMLRDAQHLTTAFKMDQERYPMTRSSVPSDRFYEDFDLEFEFLGHDTVNTHQFYYSLKPGSAQVLNTEIYSGRIRIPWDDDQHTLLKNYLSKAAQAHISKEKVDEIIFFAGHGYNSESLTARIDEKMSLMQQFPVLNRQEQGIEFIDHTFDEYIKYRLLSELARKDLDIALLHHHGGSDAQYLSGGKDAQGVTENIRSIKLYLRSKLRDAGERGRDTAKVKADYVKRYGVPMAWFDGTFSPETELADSIHWADMDIDGIELENYQAGARFIMLDACFTGSFQKDYYLSGRYVFGDGRTIAVQANTVNTIQDKFPDEMAGLLSMGVRLGEWHRHTATLETHIIGDPTFRFAPAEGLVTGDEILKAKGNVKKLLKLTSYDHPDVQAWALKSLYEEGYESISDLCLEKFMSSGYYATRMECLEILSYLRDENFTKAIAAGMNDSYELVRRMSAVFAAKCGDPELIPYLVEAIMNPNVSDRVEYQLRDALAFFNRDDVSKAISLQREAQPGYKYYDEIRERVDGWSANADKSYQRYISEIVSDESSDKDRKFAVRALRNKPFHQGVDELAAYLHKSKDPEFQVMLIEAFGWFNYSYRRAGIIEVCKEVIGSDDFTSDVKDEAVRTINRLR